MNRQTKGRIIWKASDAWACALALIALVFGIEGWLRISARASPTIARWLGTFSFRAGFIVFLLGLPLLVAFWFSRARSIRQFLSHVGLRGRPTLFGWWSAWLAIGIGFLGVYGVAKGWAHPDQRYRAFYNRGEVAVWFFAVCGTVLVPICEEMVTRGFLYRAFRGSYGPFLSTILILGVDTSSHWARISHSVFAFACIGLLTILLCVMRERTGNLWNCVLFHAAFNAASFLRWPVYVIGMILLFPYCSRPTSTLLSGRSGEESESSEASSVDASC